MRLGIDAREIQQGVYTGIGRPLANFLHYFASQNNNDSCVLFSSRKVPLFFGPKVSNVVLEEKSTFIWDQWQLPRAIEKEKITLFYSPYYKVPLRKTCAMVSAILDLMYLEYGPYRRQMKPWVKLYYETFGKAYAQSVDKILTCSQYSKQDIQRVYGIEGNKIEVIPLSVGEMYQRTADPVCIAAMKKKYGIKEKYLLYMGNFKPHKNVPNLIRAYAAVSSAFPDLQLVLAGAKEHGYADLLNLVGALRLRERVVFAGLVNEQDGPNVLYSGAEAFVFVSCYEGFGLPPAEAMACGTPVIVSNTTSLPEVVQGAGMQVDPENVQAISSAIAEVLSDPSLKESLIRKGQARVRAYGSTAIAKQTYEFFTNVNQSRVSK